MEKAILCMKKMDCRQAHFSGIVSQELSSSDQRGWDQTPVSLKSELHIRCRQVSLTCSFILTLPKTVSCTILAPSLSLALLPYTDKTVLGTMEMGLLLLPTQQGSNPLSSMECFKYTPTFWPSFESPAKVFYPWLLQNTRHEFSLQESLRCRCRCRRMSPGFGINLHLWSRS